MLDLTTGTQYIEQAAQDSHIKLLPMGFDEEVLLSDMLRSALIFHSPSQFSTTTPKVSVKVWEVHPFRVSDSHVCSASNQ